MREDLPFQRQQDVGEPGQDGINNAGWGMGDETGMANREVDAP